MKNSLLIAAREWKARMGSRSFVMMSILGPLIILALAYGLFAFGGEGKQSWRVLITDETNLLDGRILVGQKNNISYFFADGSIEHENFKDGKRYQEFDAMVEINQQVLYNKVGHIFYRTLPTMKIQKDIQYHVERRIEEVLVDEFTDFTIQDYRKIKQPLKLEFFNVYDPHNKASDLNGWLGFFYGSLIFIFIFLFGMTILRSVTKEKSNRIVEVLLASVSPNQLMFGKIVGIGLTAVVQFIIWIIVIGLGLCFMREAFFPDMLDAANMNIQELTIDVSQQSYVEQHFVAPEENKFIELIFNRANWSVMIPFFVVFFIAGYLFYGAFFSAIGASMGTETDGQQFVIPIILLLLLSLYSGYYYLNYPETSMATLLHYLPFSAPVVVMVKISQGYAPGENYQIYVSLLILIISAIVFLMIAARLYKNGILQFGHRLRMKHIFKWLRKT